MATPDLCHLPSSGGHNYGEITVTIAIETGTGDGLLSVLLFFLHSLYLGNYELSKPHSKTSKFLSSLRETPQTTTMKSQGHTI